MTKRKNPLKDLDAFLKQEASSFVNPERIAAPPTKTPDVEAVQDQNKPGLEPEQEIVIALQALAEKEGSGFRSSLYAIIRETLEKLEDSTAEDKMLINTLLYLNNKPAWKTDIRNYWSERV